MLFNRITLIEGSSTDKKIAKKIFEYAKGKKKVLVILDSNHTHQHVLKEMELYSKLVKKGSYMIVFDTIIDDMPEEFFTKRSWGKGNSPKSAVKEFLKKNSRFKIDKDIENKLLITVGPSGYLACTKD